MINPNSKDYIPGVEVHDSWRDFKRFLQDVGHTPEKNMVFSRLDKNQVFWLFVTLYAKSTDKMPR